MRLQLDLLEVAVRVTLWGDGATGCWITARDMPLLLCPVESVTRGQLRQQWSGVG